MTHVICHVPGHGGPDTGTAHGGLIERDWVLELALNLEAALAGWGVSQVFSRRTNDVNPTFVQEAAVAAQAGAGLVLLHHVNASSRPEDSGLMAFCLSGDITGLAVADAISRAAPSSLLRRPARGIVVRSDDRGWTRVHTCLRNFACPAALIEYGFATNEADRKTLMRPESKNALVAAVLVGVARYLELSYRGGSR